MNKLAKVLLLALIFAAPATVFASQAQAKTISHVAGVKSGKIKHHRNYKHHTKNLAPKTHK